MPELPDIWRKELWHPMVVHFPIALLLLGWLFRTLSVFISSTEYRPLLRKSSRLLLYPGVVAAWVAVLTGSIADAEVVRHICDPTVLESHENIGYATAALFSAALLADLLVVLLPSVSRKVKKSITEWLIILIMAVGSAYLIYGAHLGASLVYQQGAGVYHPTEDCREFE